jgi:HlyD family secretion protein
MKKRIVIPVALLVIAVALFVVFSRGNGKKYEYRFDKVTEGDITMYVTATGTINAVTSVEVGTQVSGIIMKLYADFNSIVKEGELIAQIDPTFLQQAVKDASANLERVQAQYADAKRVLERTKALFDKNLESQVNYDAATTQFESNSAALKQATATLDRARINLAYATIYAPISGVVIDRKVNVGQTVAASFSSPTLYTIANDLHKMQVQATIDESDIGKINLGQEATFTVDAYPDDRFTGTVSQIRLAPVSIQNVVNYTVIIDFNNDQLKLMPGMTANVKVLVGSSSDVLRVPNMALRFQPPADLVDSVKVKELGEGSFGMGGGRGPGMGSRDFGMGRGGDTTGSAERRARRQAIRDSIQSAHGGKLSDEELMGEMRKVFERMRQGEAPRVQTPPPTNPPKRSVQGTRFGIQNVFPEFQKAASAPVQRFERGRVWIMNSTGKLEPVSVRIGLSDGRFTEVRSQSLKLGDQIVLGATSTNEVAAGPTTNPLAPSQPRMGGGGR